jgi:hypothetical protein
MKIFLAFTASLPVRANDAIVTVNSQISGCVSPCETMTLAGLAHTPVDEPKNWVKYLLSYNHVLSDSGVDSVITCWLSGQSCSQDHRFVHLVSSSQATATIADPTRSYPQVNRLSVALPQTINMRRPFKLRIRFPYDKVEGVSIRESDGRNNEQTVQNARFERAPDGQTWLTVVPLLAGDVDFVVNVLYRDGAWSADEFQAAVGMPISAPKEFWADYMLRQSSGRHEGVGGILGADGVLQPVAIFKDAPNNIVFLKDLAKFRVLPSDGSPIVELHPMEYAPGGFRPLRAGVATVEVSFGSFRTQTRIVVMPN